MRPLWLAPPWARCGGKDPVEDGWRDLAAVTSDDVTEPPGVDCNLGVMCGAVDGCAVQAVFLNLGVAELDWAVATLPKTPWRLFTGRGEAWGYRHPGKRIPRGSRLRGAPVEVLADGCQQVAAPSRHRNGRTYQEADAWTPLLISSAPVFDLAWLLEREDSADLDAVRELVRKFPPTHGVAAWLGARAHGYREHVRACMRDAMAAGFADSFALGGRLAEDGAGVSRPDAITDADVTALRRAMDRATAENRQPTASTVLPTIKTLRRRVLPATNKATFDVVVSHGNETATLTGLTGEDLCTWKFVHGKLVENRITASAKQREWQAIVYAALPNAVDELEDEQIDSTSALANAVREILSSADAVGDNADKDLKRGRVIRDENFVMVDAEWLVHACRSRMHADKIDRRQIVNVARTLGMRESRPVITGNKRPRVWAFPMEE